MVTGLTKGITNMTTNNICIADYSAQGAYVAREKSAPVWTARCKSEYEFNGRACRRVTRRGALMCDECLSAQVVPALPRVGVLARIAGAMAALLG